MGDKQINKLDQFITQINSDTTLKHKIERINLLLTNQVHLSSEADGSSLHGHLDILGQSDLDESSSKVGGPVNYELVEMHLIDLRKFIAINTANWNTKMTEFFKKTKHADSDDESESKKVDKRDDEVLLGIVYII